MFLNRMTFQRKVLLLVGAAVAAVLLIALLSVASSANHIREARRGQLVSAVQAAANIVSGYQAKAQAGTMSVEQAQAAARDALRIARYGGADGKSDYFFIFGLDGTSVMHPFKPEWQGQQMLGKIKDSGGTDAIKGMIDGLAASKDGRIFLAMQFPRPGQTEPVPKLQHVIRIDGWNWMVGSGLYMDDVDTMVRAEALRVLGVATLVLLALAGIGWAIGRSVLRQLGGDPTLAVAAMQEVAQGNLTVQLPPAAPGSLIAALGDMVGSLRQTVSQVRQATDSIATAAAEIATGNADLSARTEQTASSLQETASSMEQLTGNVRQSADAAGTANQLASSAAGVAQQGGEVVSQVVGTMQQIHQSSQKIADIIGTIDGIAFQTNILALNAAVEAARAGEQGRGFAVVASEVRSLAQRSAEAAKQIKGLIGASVERVESGTRLVGQAGETMNEIVASVRRVTDIVGEITAAASEQSQGIGGVNGAITQLDQMTQQNAALVEESAAAAESLREQAGRLAQVVSGFRLGQEAAAPTPVARPVSAKLTKPAASRPAASKPAAALTTRKPAAPAAAAPAPAAMATDEWASF